MCIRVQFVNIHFYRTHFICQCSAVLGTWRLGFIIGTLGTHCECWPHAIPVRQHSSAQVRAVVDHGHVVVPEDVGGWLRCLPQEAVELQLGANLDKLLMSFLLLSCFWLESCLVFNLDLSKCIYNKIVNFREAVSNIPRNFLYCTF